MSLLDTASLIVTPNAYKEGKLYSVIPSDGSGDLSVTRATTATRVNSAGLVELVPYNLVQYSEQFDNSSAWAAFSGTTLTANTATAPDGTMSADRIQGASGGFRGVRQSIALDTTTCTLSVYLKSATGANQNARIWIDTTSQVVALTTEWQRFTLTALPTTSTFDVTISTAIGASIDVYAWGAQLVEGSVAKDYQKTETRLNIPRLDYSNGTCPSILVEPQRTNKITYSENQGPSGTNWYPTSTWSVTNNSIISPSGIQNADTLTEDTSNGYHAGYFNAVISNGFTGTYTISAYAKYNGRFFVLSPKGASERTYFNLQDGTIAQLGGGGVTANIEDCGNGWYRCSVTCSFSSENVNFEYLLASAVGTLIYTGNGTSGVYIWGAQAEEGSYATSYIPTTSASVTRNADVISKTGISSLIGQTEGTLFVDFIPTERNNARYISIEAASGVGSGWIGIFSDSVSPFKFRFYGDGFDFYSINGIQLNERYKVALSYKNGVLTSAYVNGINQGTLTANTTSKSYANFKIGTAQIGNRGDGEYNAVSVWPIALSDNQLATLTTI